MFSAGVLQAPVGSAELVCRMLQLQDPGIVMDVVAQISSSPILPDGK